MVPRIKYTSCIFCGGRPLSREDVIPNWLKKLWGPIPGAQATQATSVAQTPFDTPRTTRPRVIRNVTIRVKATCIPCNTGWMSRLDTRAKPFLLPLVLGRSMTLDADGQEAVATWAAKTAIMLACASGISTSQRFLDDLYFRQEPPSDTYIVCTTLNPRELFWRVTAVETRPENDTRLHGHVTGLGLAHLGLVVVVSPAPGYGLITGGTPFVWLWPPLTTGGHDIDWPLRVGMSPRAFSDSVSTLERSGRPS